MNAIYQEIRSELKKSGLLLLTDAVLPSLTSIVAGGSVKGSWWGHPKGNLMYNLSNDLSDEKDVLSVKLLNKKVTFVHKKLWDALYAVGTAREDWQMQKLIPAHKNLLKSIESKSEVRADDSSFKRTPGEIGKLASKLEERLLIYSDSIHTDSGKHVRLLKTWKKIMDDKGYVPRQENYAAFLMAFEKIRESLSEEYGSKIVFPWT